MILVIDDVLEDPQGYRAEALMLPFRTYDFEHCVFHGIAVADTFGRLPQKIIGRFPDLEPTLTFFRKSPLGQIEPHFIHTDIDMGDWSAILYLNPAPPLGDGTSFWTHLATGTIESAVPHERSIEGNNPANFACRQTVQSKFNRLLMFPSSYFHSRNIHENWGDGDAARLTQVAFGKGVF